jgi:hypothetical protein
VAGVVVEEVVLRAEFQAAGRVSGRGAGRGTSGKANAAVLAEANQAHVSTTSELLARIAILEAQQPVVHQEIVAPPAALAQAHGPLGPQVPVVPISPPPLIIASPFR